MSVFLTPLTTTKLGPLRWLLVDDLVFASDQYRGRFIVPRGFQTDLASIPRALWTCLPRVGGHDRAAVLHDAAYGHALVTPGGERIHAIKRVADDLFAEALRADGVGLARHLMVAGVRRFGRPSRHPLAEQTP